MILKLKKYDEDTLILLQAEYNRNLNVVYNENGSQCLCMDADYEDLFTHSHIDYLYRVNEEKRFKYNEGYEPVGCDYGDYLRTEVYEQNGIKYGIPVYCVFNGSGADEGLALDEMRKVD